LKLGHKIGILRGGSDFLGRGSFSGNGLDNGGGFNGNHRGLLLLGGFLRCRGRSGGFRYNSGRDLGSLGRLLDGGRGGGSGFSGGSFGFLNSGHLVILYYKKSFLNGLTHYINYCFNYVDKCG
jgi:hypothetical protein